MKNEVKLRIVDEGTGEILPIDKRPSDLKDYVLSLPDDKKADLLTKANYMRRIAGGLEKAVKGFVKEHVDLDFDEENRAMWQAFKILKMNRASFDKDRFEEEGSDEEKEIIKQARLIESKYQKTTEYLKF